MARTVTIPVTDILDMVEEKIRARLWVCSYALIELVNRHALPVPDELVETIVTSQHCYTNSTMLYLVIH
jgi:hypothetical protein